MKFELILQGDKKIVITREQADRLTKGILAKEDVFKIGENVFKRAAFKGMFPLPAEIVDNKEAWFAENKAWHETCLHMSKNSIEDKVTIELTNRIFPGLNLNKITLTDGQVAVMEANIRAFFTQNQKYPRCPLRIWWPFLKEAIAPENTETKKRPNPSIAMAKWWEYVLRNDAAIEEWLHYN